MNVEIRSATKDEMPEFRAVTAYVFAENESDASSGADALVAPEWTTCAFVDGQLATTLGSYPFRMRLNGATADVAGLTAVGTLPQFRRRGLLRQTIAQSFREQRERGQSMAILWASFAGIYQRFGYGPASNSVTYDFDPRWAGLHEGLSAGGTVSATLDREAAMPTLKQIYRAYSEPRNLLLHRAAASWAFGVCRAHDKKHRTHIAVYRDTGGEPRGFVVYQLENKQQPSPNQRLDVCDFIALDVDAHIGLWQYLLSHDLVDQVRTGPVSEEDPSPLLVQEASKLGRRVWDGLFLRVVDAERALSVRPYPETDRLRIEIAEDPLCDWNQGTFEVESEAGESRAKRSSGVPDLSLPPRSLASLLCGHSSASQLARAGLLDAKDDAVLRRADRFFATAFRPFCPDGF
ncbi:MAG: GNAT family N-acetyltransferase [Myxococcota bacterium]|nr:GNAT family N-acetyltransferase [Myxococcota bacterium]